jgi:hypothetical protein
MTAKQLYQQPVLIDLGEVDAETLGEIEAGDEVFTMKLPNSDI